MQIETNGNENVKQLGVPVGQGASVLLPTLCTAFAVHRIGRGKVRRFGLRQIAVKIGAVRFLEAGAQAKVGQLDVTARVQQQIIRLYVSMNETQFVDRIDR